MIKTVVITKHIHSGFSSFQSGDEFLKIVTNSKELDFIPVINQTIQSKNFPELHNQLVVELDGDKEFIGIYLNSDETFCRKASLQRNYNISFSKTPEFKELIQFYTNKGFKVKSEIPEQTAFREREKLKSQRINKKKGIVLWMDFNQYVENSALYQGGFSDDVFNSKELYNYIKGGCAYGWIGNSSERTSTHDKQIEKGLRKRGISPSQMCKWISSSDGRHFGDSLGGCTPKEQKEKIDKRLNGMYNSCLIYAAPSHKGMFSDSNRIENEFGKLGILLPENGKYNSRKHIENLLKAKEHFSKIKDLNEDEEFINSIINEIFANKI